MSEIKNIYVAITNIHLNSSNLSPSVELGQINVETKLQRMYLINTIIFIKSCILRNYELYMLDNLIINI